MSRATVRIAPVVSLLIAVWPRAAAAETTVLYHTAWPATVSATAGLTITPATATFTAVRNIEGGVRVRAGFGGTDYWFAEFSTADNAPLAAGMFINVQRFPFMEFNVLSFWRRAQFCNDAMTGAKRNAASGTAHEGEVQ